MPWFRVDDSLAFHAKTVAAGNAAMGMWLRAGTWCAQQLTDGFVPSHMVSALGSRGQAAALVKAGMWRQEDGGYRFHDWLDYQPTAAEVQADRSAKHEAKVRAGRAGGVASGVARRKHNPSNGEAEQEANAEQNEAPTRPDPTRPKTPGTRKRATATPDVFPITPEMAAWGQENAPHVADPHAETRRFLDWTRANGKTYKDWTAAWRNWMSKADGFATERPTRRPPNPNIPDTDEWRLG